MTDTADDKALEVVEAIFTDLRDRRFLKWLFDRRGDENLIGRFDDGEELRGLDLEVQGQIKAAWQVIISAALSASPAQPVAIKPLERYQDRVASVHGPLFDGDPTDVEERRARFFEEANEACQALGMTREEARQLVDYTYDRPVGEPAKEVGAAMLTLTSLCVVADLDLMACAEADLEKLQRPETIARIRAKRSTRHGRGPLPGLDAAPSASIEGETP